MSAQPLVLVAPRVEPESASDRIRRLQSEARALARDQVETLGATLAQAAQLARDVSNGGDAYPVGARELARRLADYAAGQAQTLTCIAERVWGPQPRT